MNNDILRELGVGASWGTRLFRIGRSGSRTWWISVGVPGTGIRFSKVLGRIARRSTNYLPDPQREQAKVEAPALTAIAGSLTHNQEIVEEMRSSQPQRRVDLP